MIIADMPVYHSILTVQRTVMNKCHAYIHEKIHTETRHNARNTVKYGENFKGKTERTQNSFCYRGLVFYTKLPLEITQVQNMKTLK